MRVLLALFFLFFQLSAQEAKQKVTIGLGPYFQTQPYKDVSTILVPSPVIFFDNGLFYVRWSRAGMYFLGDKQEDYMWGFSITAQPRPNGYNSSDSSYLKGMDDRYNTIEGGLAFSATYKDTYIEIMALTDLLDRYDSWIVRTEIGDKYTLGKFSFYPSIILMYESDKFVDYYYGVTQEEASRTPYNYYKPSGGFDIGIQTYIRYPITDNFAALVNIRADRIPETAIDSPLTNDSYIYSGLLSLIYTFEY